MSVIPSLSHVIPSGARNLPVLALRFFTPLRFVQNDMVGAASMDSRLRGNDGLLGSICAMR